jgi:hypothetical protein
LQNPHRLNFFTFRPKLANKKGTLHKESVPSEVFPDEEKLKLKTCRKLNLAFTIQSAVGSCHLLEVGHTASLVKT